MIGKFRLVRRFASAHPAMFRFQKAEHVFVHDTLMAKTFLRLIPKRVTPNQVTSFRILFTPLAVYAISLAEYDWGVALFLLLAFTDVIDGSLARTRDMVTQWGMMFDPLADKLLVGSMILLVVLTHFPLWIGITILAIEVLFVLSAAIAKLRFHEVHAANRWGKVKMLAQVIAVSVTLMALVFNIPYLLSIASWVFGLSIGFAVVSLFTQGM